MVTWVTTGESGLSELHRHLPAGSRTAHSRALARTKRYNRTTVHTYGGQVKLVQTTRDERLPPDSSRDHDQPRNPANGSCSAINPASQNTAIQVTIRYNFVPLTPIIQQVTANSIILTAYTVYRTEY